MAATLTKALPGLLRPLSVLGRDCLTKAVKVTYQSPRFSTLVQKHVFRPLPLHNTVQQTALLDRKSVKSVVQRFLRLHCGLWVRRKAGYKKKLWKKSAARKKRLREHVFCNKTQCKLLDKMTTSFWKRRNWYLNDPYQKYHDRSHETVSHSPFIC
ncbi:39S ribosomal protein L35 [Triplophysa rosa]|uniref:Large ribosomal subunit protein bL35m n=1 Tax=Triplophysa rosa TaxID=992332 RepID=A0A9W7TWB7_TRIRA|nr:39S ribosomal protein L35 [Triplophysa rosa]